MKKYIIRPISNDDSRKLSFKKSCLILGDKVRKCFYLLELGRSEDDIKKFLSMVKKMPCQKGELTFSVVLIKKDNDILNIVQFLKKIKIQASMFETSSSHFDLDFDFKHLTFKIDQKLLNSSSVVQKKKLLIVEDSPSMIKILTKIFEAISEIEIVGVAKDVQEGIDLISKLNPDLISLDMMLPSGTGLDIMRKVDQKKTKVILITDCSNEQGGIVFECLSLGALTYFKKPALKQFGEFKSRLENFILEVFRKKADTSSLGIKIIPSTINLNTKSLIVIGSSTGGTEIIRDLLKDFPKDSPPIVIVQHMPPEFTRLYSERLTHQSKRKTTEVRGEVELKQGEAYLAAGGTQLKIFKRGGRYFAVATDDDHVNRFKPSVSYMFESIHKLNLGNRVLALMLTGMGSDGSIEMKKLKDQGALCIGQKESSCTVYGMPRAAKELNAVEFELSPEEMIHKFSTSLDKAS